jgi:hypothetical protein
VDIDTATLTIAAEGPAGADANIFVAMPPGTPVIETLVVNGVKLHVSAFSTGTYRDVPTLTVVGSWQGVAFGKNHEIIASTSPTASTTATVNHPSVNSMSPAFAGGAWSGEFTVPPTVIAQLQERNESYPIVWDTSTDGNNDANVPWLAPGRLLMFVKYAPLLNDTFNVTGSIDGKELLVRKAYNTIVHGARFSTEISTRGCHWFPPLLRFIQASRRVTNDIPLGCPLFLPARTVKLRPNTEGDLREGLSGTGQM